MAHSPVRLDLAMECCHLAGRWRVCDRKSIRVADIMASGYVLIRLGHGMRIIITSTGAISSVGCAKCSTGLTDPELISNSGHARSGQGR